MTAQHVTRLSSPSDYSNFLSKYDNFLLDCDGNNSFVIGVTLQACSGLEMIFYPTSNKLSLISAPKTKNSSLSPTTLPNPVDHTFRNSPNSESPLTKRKFSEVVIQQPFICLESCIFPKTKRFTFSVRKGVEEELEAEGIAYEGGTSPSERGDFEESDFDTIKPKDEIGAVLCGLDQHITYKKLARALVYLQSPEVLFLATNTDSTYPTHGKLFPGAGTTTTIPLQFASGRKATTCGKPNQTMMDAIFARFELDKERTCMVGDRLDTDIQFGLQGKLGGTLLILTGVSSLEDCEKMNIYPQYVMDGFGDFTILEEQSK